MSPTFPVLPRRFRSDANSRHAKGCLLNFYYIYGIDFLFVKKHKQLVSNFDGLLPKPEFQIRSKTFGQIL